MAKIVFQKKQYFLGSYDDLDSARRARSEAEELISEQVVRHYECWKAAADRNPAWALKHPIQIQVDKTQSGRLSVQLLPEMNEIQENMPVRMIG